MEKSQTYWVSCGGQNEWLSSNVQNGACMNSLCVWVSLSVCVALVHRQKGRINIKKRKKNCIEYTIERGNEKSFHFQCRRRSRATIDHYILPQFVTGFSSNQNPFHIRKRRIFVSPAAHAQCATLPSDDCWACCHHLRYIFLVEANLDDVRKGTAKFIRDTMHACHATHSNKEYSILCMK